MKKTLISKLLFLFVGLGFFIQLPAQNQYFSFGLSYNHSAAPNLFSNTEMEDVGGTETVKRLKGSGSFGRGIQANVAFARRINQHIFWEMGVAYLYGLNAVSTYKSSNGNFSEDYKSSINGRMLRLLPAIRINAGEGNVQPYMKTGAVIGVLARLNHNDKTFSKSPFGDENDESTTIYKGRASLGFTAALGLQFKLKEKLGFYTEINMITQSWAPKKSVMTKYTSNGEDQLDQMPVSAKETDYEDEYTVSYNSDSPFKEIKYFLPFSSIGLQFGLVWTL